MSENKNSNGIIDIECPRCGGAGRLPQRWQPDGGVCYRCKGVCTVTVNVFKARAHLRHLRREYRQIQAELKNAQSEGARELLEERLTMVTERGIRVRTELETAEAKLAS